MRKVLCLLIVIIAFSSSSYAQIVGENMRLGFQITPAYSWFGSPNTDIETSGGGSFGFGVVADYYIGDNYALGTGINMQYTKGDIAVGTGDDFAEGSYRFGYLEIPITIKLSTNDVGYLRYFGQVGVGVGFPILRSRYSFNYSNNDPRSTELTMDEWPDNDKAGDSVTPFNFSMIISAGAEYAVTENTSAFVALWFDKGFVSAIRNKAYKNDFLYDDKDNKTTISYMGLRVGVLF